MTTYATYLVTIAKPDTHGATSPEFLKAQIEAAWPPNMAVEATVRRLGGNDSLVQAFLEPVHDAEGVFVA